MDKKAFETVLKSAFATIAVANKEFPGYDNETTVACGEYTIVVGTDGTIVENNDGYFTFSKNATVEVIVNYLFG